GALVRDPDRVREDVAALGRRRLRGDIDRGDGHPDALRDGGRHASAVPPRRRAHKTALTASRLIRTFPQSWTSGTTRRPAGAAGAGSAVRRRAPPWRPAPRAPVGPPLERARSPA